MAKDPAFLFYPGDWLGGTMAFNFEQKGAYLELLLFQFNSGKFTETQAQQVLNTSYTSVWQVLKSKFKSEDGFFWNEKLELIKEKRQTFTDSRRTNRLGKGKKMKRNTRKTLVKLVENENEIKSIVIYLNNKVGSDFKINTPKTIALIQSRLKEGFTVENFKSVIDKKATEWMSNDEMVKYLRPETLFGTKFESYFNQKSVQSSEHKPMYKTL